MDWSQVADMQSPGRDHSGVGKKQLEKLLISIEHMAPVVRENFFYSSIQSALLKSADVNAI